VNAIKGKQQKIYNMRNLILALFLISSISLSAQIELQVGAYQTTAGEKNNEIQLNKQPDFFAGFLLAKRVGCIQGMIDVKATTTKRLEAQALAHFDLLWLFEPISDLFANGGNQISILAGGGYKFSNEYYNNMELPMDLRVSIQTKKLRVQAGVQIPLLEASYYEDNYEAFVIVSVDIPRFRKK
jgi:hypothetical protein